MSVESTSSTDAATTGTRLAGRTAIVTGAGQGVGEGIALRLAAEGANVVVAARRAETGEPVAEAIRARGGSGVCIETDVSSRESVQACVAHFSSYVPSLLVSLWNAWAAG